MNELNFCKLSGCEALKEDCWKDCPNGQKPFCMDCKYWDLCRGMLHDGIGCFEPSDKAIVQKTISHMLNKFGEDSQIDVTIEEMSELIKELVKFKRSKIHSREKQAASRDHVVEEIGDVMFMMEYLKTIFQITDSEIQQVVVQKALRTKERYLDAKDN